MSSLIHAYTSYVKKKAEIRARQRIELQTELDPYLKAFGDQIIKAQGVGKRIEDIEYEIGAKNRTLVYAAKRRSKTGKPAQAVVPEEEVIEPEKPSWRHVGSDPYGDYFVLLYEVGERRWEIPVYDDVLEVPDEWAVDEENRDTYREIIRHAKGLIN